MTVQERIDSRWVINRFKDGWKEGTVEELESDYPFMKGYVDKINWYGKNTRVAIFKEIEKPEYCLYMYSDKHEYRITLNPRYMGGIANCRARRPLEDWLRGYDLPDGKPCEDTLQRILFAILSSEIVGFDDGSRAPRSGEMEDMCGNDMDHFEFHC